MDVLLPGTMVKGHDFQYGLVVAWYYGETLCQFLWSLSGFCIMPKEVYMDVLVLNDIARLGPGAIISLYASLLCFNYCRIVERMCFRS
jgi:hypothetical protein